MMAQINLEKKMVKNCCVNAKRINEKIPQPLNFSHLAILTGIRPSL
jgi:hypothetical protein